MFEECVGGGVTILVAGKSDGQKYHNHARFTLHSDIMQRWEQGIFLIHIVCMLRLYLMMYHLKNNLK